MKEFGGVLEVISSFRFSKIMTNLMQYISLKYVQIKLKTLPI